MTTVEFLQVGVGAVVLLVAVAFVITYLRANISKGTIELYRADNDALRARIITLESEDHRKSNAIASLQGTVTVLRDTVTQKDAIARLEKIARAWAQREHLPYD